MSTTPEITGRARGGGNGRPAAKTMHGAPLGSWTRAAPGRLKLRAAARHRGSRPAPLSPWRHRKNAWSINGLSHDSGDRKSTRLNSSHVAISYAVFCLKKKKVVTADEGDTRQRIGKRTQQ